MNETTLSCWLCDSPVEHGHRSHRGLLINTIASLSSAQITRREQLQQLQNRRWKGSQARERQQAEQTIRRLLSEIERDEALLERLYSVKTECYG